MHCLARNVDAICDQPIERQVVEVYGAIGKMLKSYTAGKLPKAFKIIPSLTNWEQVNIKFSTFRRFFFPFMSVWCCRRFRGAEDVT